MDNIKIYYDKLSVREQILFKGWLLVTSDKTTDEYDIYYKELLENTKLKLFNKREMVIATKTQP